MKKIALYLLAALMVSLLAGCGGSTEPVGKIPNDGSSKSETENMPTAVSTVAPAAETQPQTKNVQELIIKQNKDIYTYNNLVSDIVALQETYGDAVKVIKVCETFDKRDVYDVVVGNLDSENQILIFGAMHAREYITTQIVMNQLCDCLENSSGAKNDMFNGISAAELLKDTAVHFIPMSNPDGVTISQLGPEALQTQNAKDKVLSICAANGFSDYPQWKANAEGIDINRNFDAGWEEYNDNVGAPAPDHYKGTSPGSATEADGLIQVTQKYNFDRTISYHTKGSLIYWYYLQSGTVLDESKGFAEAIANVTGYTLDSDYTAVDAAGYKDWAVYKMGIPSVTIEVGGEAPDNPVPYGYFGSIWEKNKSVVWATLYDLKF